MAMASVPFRSWSAHRTIPVMGCTRLDSKCRARGVHSRQGAWETRSVRRAMVRWRSMHRSIDPGSGRIKRFPKPSSWIGSHLPDHIQPESMHPRQPRSPPDFRSQVDGGDPFPAIDQALSHQVFEKRQKVQSPLRQWSGEKSDALQMRHETSPIHPPGPWPRTGSRYPPRIRPVRRFDRKLPFPASRAGRRPWGT